MQIKRLAICTLALASMVSTAWAKPDMQSFIKEYQSIVDVSPTVISPDGTHVAWSQSLHHKTSLWIENLATKQSVRLTAAATETFADEHDAQFSPESTSVAFLSDARGNTTQAYIAKTDGSGVRRVGNLTGAAQALHWSPDGTRLAFLYVAHPHRHTGATSAGARITGVVGSVDDEQQIATLDVRSGKIALVTPGDDYVYEYDWSPDSARFAFTYARGNGDNNWWIAKLATIASNGGELHDVLKPDYQMNAPTWAPDGKSIAFIGGLMSDFGPVGGDVYLVNADGGDAKDLTPNADFNASAIHFARANAIDLVVHRMGSLHLTTLHVDTGAVDPLIGNDESFRSVSYAKDGRVALVRASFTRAPEVWMGQPNALAQVTHVNEHAPNLYGGAQSVTWKSDTYTVQGWLISPLNYDPAKKYPLVVIVHGGPSSESVPSFSNNFVGALAANGYFVLEPNPRGSYGQGENFTAANRKDFGYGDWRDILAGVDAATNAASIDPQRIGLFGWSYGGYMAMWAETQSTRFKAIVSGAGVANWQSYYGQNNINQWMVPFFGASVYDDPAVYAKSSPMTFIKNAHSPMLLLTGERDEEVPAPQSFEYYNALQTLGVPSQMVVYADEGHGVRQPKNQIDLLVRTVGWFDKYLR